MTDAEWHRTIRPLDRPPYAVTHTTGVSPREGDYASSTVNSTPYESSTTCPKCGATVPGIRLWEHGFGHRVEEGLEPPEAA